PGFGAEAHGQSRAVADSPQSLIRNQVRNGLYARMALLLTLMREEN
ncbi:MAG: hypothetical protein IIC63_00005, partial [Proteobacteria bacterium]|nr:hypothetical protein [Pseudomonadota bacterium]